MRADLDYGRATTALEHRRKAADAAHLAALERAIIEADRWAWFVDRAPDWRTKYAATIERARQSQNETLI